MKNFNTFSACVITCLITTIMCCICISPKINPSEIEIVPTIISITKDGNHYNVLHLEGEKYITDVTNTTEIRSEQEWINIRTQKIVSKNPGPGLDSYDLLNVILDINKKRRIKKLMSIVE